jgi:rubrerythrin
MERMTWEQILNRAIAKEGEAHSNYLALAGWVRDPGSQQMLRDLAEEERKHKEILEKWQGGKIPGSPPPTLPDLGVAGNRRDFKLDKDLTPEEAVRAAIREEEMAHSFYESLGKSLEEGEAQAFARRLAAEEQKHKFKLESLLAAEWQEM